MSLIHSGNIQRISVNRAARQVTFALTADVQEHTFVVADDNGEMLDSIGLTNKGDEIWMVTYPSEGDAPAVIRVWTNHTLDKWLNVARKAEREKLNAQLQPLIETMQQQLEKQGWTPIKGGTAIARKNYVTAVGIKEALAYVSDFGPQEGSVRLQGDYQSEGRNCLSTTSELIARTASVEEVGVAAQKFAIAADVSVGQSYAARLHQLAQAA